MRRDPRALRARAARSLFFFGALAQSALGTGAALRRAAPDRLRALRVPVGDRLVLLADLVPAMFLGPVFGAVADRWSRRTCMIVADVMRVGRVRRHRPGRRVRADRSRSRSWRGLGTGLFTPARWRRCRASSSRAVAGGHLPLRGDRRPRLHRGAGHRGGVLLVGGPESRPAANAVTFAHLGAGARAAPLRRGPRRAETTSDASIAAARGRTASWPLPGCLGCRVCSLASARCALLRRPLQRRRAALRDRRAGSERRRLLGACRRSTGSASSPGR